MTSFLEPSLCNVINYILPGSQAFSWDSAKIVWTVVLQKKQTKCDHFLTAEKLENAILIFLSMVFDFLLGKLL